MKVKKVIARGLEKGDVVLKDLKLKAEALNSLKLPVFVRAGFVGTITLKVPWNRLGKEPVVVLIDRVFVLAHPAPDGQTLKEEDREKLFEAKLQQIEEAELATLEATTRRSKHGSPPGGSSWLGSLVATIIGNLKISISNVHIRYEDSVSNPGHPFCSGVTLAKLAAVTMDEQGNETFDTSGALDKLRKRLAVYHDSDSFPWKVHKNWEDLNPKEWTEIFEDGINEVSSDHGIDSVWALNRKYLVSPINGVLKYHRLGKQEMLDPEIPLEKASLVLSDVSLSISEAQYYDGIKLLETISRYKTYIESSNVDGFEVRQIEKDLDSKVIILWRLLAHAKVESVKSKEAAQRKGSLKRNWLSFGWRSSSEDASNVKNSVESGLVEEGKLTKDEWQAINNLLSYEPEEDATFILGKDMQNMIQFLVNVSIGQAAARIININQTEILCGRFEQLQVTTKMYHKSICCDMSLKFYGLSAPEGSLAQSVSSGSKSNALVANFVRSPVGESVDWRLSATIAPCHVTVLMESYNRFLEFIKRSNAVSPTIALETATALQSKIEKVTRRAQEQFQMVLEEQSRFALDVDFDAPKVRVPLGTCISTSSEGHFLLDFGHFTLQTREDQLDEQRQSLYSRFYISGRDIAAFFIDCSSGDDNTLASGIPSCLPKPEDVDHFYSLIDRCGMSVIVDQIKIPHPSYPSTRISVQVPNLGMHFSPARYGKLMDLLNILYGSKENSDQNSDGYLQTGLVPWHPADLASDARILVWRKPHKLISDVAGRQVSEVSSTSVGGSLFSVAVSFRGVDLQKALESSNTLIIEFRDDIEKTTWLKELIQATYRASAPPALDILGESSSSLSEYDGARTPGKHDDPEELILDVLASGGKVNLVRVGGDLTVKMKLHSLKIKDELQGRSSLTPQYLAYSVQKDNLGNNSPSTLESDGKGSHRFFLDDDDIFKDALPEFLSTPDQSFYSPNFEMAHNMKSNPFDAIDNRIRLDSADALIYDKELGKGRSPGEVFYEARDDDQYDFVTVTFATRNPDSPVYEGIDTQMSICMSKLEFFCNRPTLVALIQFGLDLSLESSDSTSINELNVMEAEYSQDKDKTEENGRSCISGLLGYGKSRVVFHLNMDVNSVCVFLNKEDNTQLAMFVQEKFLFDLKFEFKSYSAEDDDYEGHDYSLRGRLSAVRIVFLYRFVQEITAYFVELATPQTEEAIKFVDKVGGFEWLIQKYEIDGATALKLDLSLDTPTIIVPRNSLSKDFMQLDLGKLRVTNNFSWHGFQENDPSAVHLDVLYAEIQGINMAVGVNGVIGKPMMREGKGLSIQVCRSLRDVFRKVPTMSVEVKVGLLHCVISDKEYNVILDCAYMNISEEPRIPPSFRGNMTSQKVSIRMLADKVNLNSQILLLHTVVVVEIEIQNALLELYNGIDEESPLAQIALEDLWLSYRTTSSSEIDLYVTIPKFSVLDIRPDTKHEMRLMLGSSSDVSKQGFCNNPEFMENHAASPSHDDLTEFRESGASLCVPTATMLLMDYRLRSSSQSFVVRIQQPRVLVVLDFLLPVVEFFVPAFGTALGREEMLHPKNDPIIRNENIVLSEPLYKQADDVVYLSPSRQLIVDGHGVDEFTYDGCGGTICLSEEFHFQNEMQPIIIIGCGKKLHFQNVKIENAALLRKYTYLSNDSSYSASVEDGVEILFLDSSTSNIDEENSNPQAEYSKTGIVPVTEPGDARNQIKSFTFEAQVVSPEFTFYDGTKLSVDNDIHGEKLLRAKMDLSFMYAVKENDIWVRALVKDLTIEAGSGLIVLEPVDVSGGYTSAATALQFGNADLLSPCSNFKKLWVSEKEYVPGHGLTFWRPQAPSNYAILGDCVTSRPIPPTQVVMAVSNTYGRVRKPLSFKLIGSFSNLQGLEREQNQINVDNECSLWLPIAPPGYSALGCVAHVGNKPPPNHLVFCVRSDLLTSTVFSDCVFSVPSSTRVLSGFSIWRVDNISNSFYAHDSVDCPPKNSCFNLRQIILGNTNRHFSHNMNSSIYTNQENVSQQGSTHGTSYSGWDILRSFSRSNGYYMTTPHFERIWWDKGCELRQPVSIWRPLPRPGFAILGDCIVEGLEPPALGFVFKYDNSGISAKPVQFTKVAHISKRGFDEAYFWYPIAPPGYASMGCIISKTDEACTFLARSDHKKPSIRLAYNIGDCAKPKMREDISADMKLGCLSITVLDSSCGMMTPILDTTITNLNLATHGRLEAMNAVLVCSIASSTFNRHIEAWEPLIEPFDGIFKAETFAINESLPPRIGKRIRIAATSTVNINISSANLESLAESIISWRKQVELEKIPTKSNGESGEDLRHADDPALSALEEDDLQKELPITDDGNKHDFFCALRLVINDKGTDQQKLFPQSARTRCVKPIIYQHEGITKGTAAWNELFIFEIPLRGLANLEVEVTNLASRAGKGEVIGGFSMPIGNDVHALRRVASAKFLQNAADTEEMFSVYQLRRKGQYSTDENRKDCGYLLLSASYYDRNTVVNLQRDMESMITADRDVGFLIGLSPDGPWEAFRSLLPLSVVPKVLDGNCFASEVVMKNGRKHAIFRALGMIVNDADIKVEVAMCPLSAHADHTPQKKYSTITEEIFENQRYLPTFGWGNKFAFNGNDPAHWSTRDFSNSSKDFFEPPLPSGWKWTSAWTIEKSPFVDGDGWTYGADFESLIWPPTSSRSSPKSAADCVRRRRWVRKREPLFERDNKETIDVFASMSPGSSAILPWRSMATDAELCLQVRPQVAQSPYTWGQMVPIGSGYDSGNDQFGTNQALLSRPNTTNKGNASIVDAIFKLSQLEKKDVLLCCYPCSGIKQQFWLSIGSDASVLHTELNVPVYDWKISINSPLKLENRLPYQAEFAIWERTNEGNRVERQRGLIPSGSSASIYSADLRKPLYLTLFVQGGWILEKNVDINNPMHYDIMVEPRRLRVSVERDMGGNNASPKTVRFFVPYWINNNSTVPLSYRVVEVESVDSAETDTLLISRAVKSAKLALKPKSFNGRNSISKRNIRVLEAIEDSSSTTVMLSPQDYTSRSGILAFPSRNDAFLSPHVGIAVAILHSDYYGPGISLVEMENKERVDVRAFTSRGSYYKLSAVLNMASDRTKVINFQPRILLINRSGRRVSLQQCGTQMEEWINPTDPPKLFQWQSHAKNELLKVRLDGCKWSTPFSIENEGVMRVSMKNEMGNEQMFLRVEVRSGTKHSRYEVVFRLATVSSPYRIENRSLFLPVRFRQAGGTDDSWQSLPPNAAAAFFWEDIGRKRILEVLVDGTDPLKSEKYNIDEIKDHQPMPVVGGPVRALRLSVSKEGKTYVSRISDWMPESVPLEVMNMRVPMPLSQLSGSDFKKSPLDVESEFHITFELTELGISIIDNMPEEGPENCAFLVNIHEPIIWRLHEMIQQVNINRLYDPQTAAVSVDPIIQIGLLNISEIRFKVSMAMSPAQRPRGVLGFWSSLMTSLGNTEHMPVRINQRFLEEVCMRQSSLIGAAISNIQKDLLSQPLQLLSGVDILGNASSALGHMSKGVAALSMDKKFIQNRQKKENKSVEDIGDVIREGGGAFAKGLFRGVTGILTKPLEGAKSSGVEGFVQGVGKGIIGAAAQPVSGVLDLLSKTTEGANAVKMKITSAITSEEQLLRRRLPRVISGDNLLHPYDEYKAQGQVILQLAESGTFFGQVDLFKVRGKFALSDAYEDHFLLPKGKIFLVTHRRVLLLQQPTNIVGQRKFNPARDPCSVLWDVVWDDLAAMELVQGKKERPESPPSCLVLYLKINSTESKECTRVIKCIRESPQAINVYSSIEQVMNTYGPNHLKDMQKKVTKPYSPRKAYTEVFPKEAFDVWGSQDVLTSVPISSTFGTVLSQPQFSQDSRQ
ncbi:hypothetical protein QJS04_geneDACA015489 [Acorus gramineus]|uniref:Peroxin/Ferlin domain-containing protein n=1 Tax=Acorus gramineus TaxID=55184 RepID=A0AAV9A7B3_ACOGR|nr:hypothetical protein QJS04_geneDACA015489 [Acorus gramineus]